MGNEVSITKRKANIMATQTYKKCPHCGKVYEYYSTYTKQYRNHSGSPFVTCKYCGESFIDKDIKEPALKPYEGDLGILECFTFFLFPFGVAGVFFLICAFNTEEYFLISLIISILSLGGYLALTIHTIVSRKRITESLKKDYIESEKRLKNPLYAKALKEAGYQVPDKYLN